MRAWYARRRDARLAKRRLLPCGEWSPGLTGYQCELPYEHDGEHAAVTLRKFCNGQETSRRTVKWL